MRKQEKLLNAQRQQHFEATEALKEELQSRVKTLQAQLDEERRQNEENLMAHLAGWSDKEKKMVQMQMKLQQELEVLQQTKTDLEKENDRLMIQRTELDDHLDAKEDLIATLEESLEEAKFQVKALTERLNQDGEKHKTEV